VQTDVTSAHQRSRPPSRVRALAICKVVHEYRPLMMTRPKPTTEELIKFSHAAAAYWGGKGNSGWRGAHATQALPAQRGASAARRLFAAWCIMQSALHLSKRATCLPDCHFVLLTASCCVQLCLVLGLICYSWGANHSKALRSRLPELSTTTTQVSQQGRGVGCLFSDGCRPCISTCPVQACLWPSLQSRACT
jgi:hypothetical protein